MRPNILLLFADQWRGDRLSHCGSAAGYRTLAVGRVHVFPEHDRLGFESVELYDGYLQFVRRNAADLDEIDNYVPWLREATGRPGANYAEHDDGCNSIVARPWDGPEPQHPTNRGSRRAVDFLCRLVPGREAASTLSRNGEKPSGGSR